jgi:hypothetical protein
MINFTCAAKAVAGELESHFLGVASILRAEAPVKPAAAAHTRRQRVIEQLSGAPHHESAQQAPVILPLVARLGVAVDFFQSGYFCNFVPSWSE